MEKLLKTPLWAGSVTLFCKVFTFTGDLVAFSPFNGFFLCFYKVGRNYFKCFLILGTRFRFETKRGQVFNECSQGKRKVNFKIYKLCTNFLINYFLIRLSKIKNLSNLNFERRFFFAIRTR